MRATLFVVVHLKYLI